MGTGCTVIVPELGARFAVWIHRDDCPQLLADLLQAVGSGLHILLARVDASPQPPALTVVLLCWSLI